MEGEFSQMQPQLENKYVMVDWDDTMSLSPEHFQQIFKLFEDMQLIPMVITARHPSDSSDIYAWVNEDRVIFCNGKQKKDVLTEHGIEKNQVAFWVDDSPEAIISKSDAMWLLNKPHYTK